MNDITTQEDIKTLVHSFYERVNADALLSPVFNETARVNWEEHLPLLCQFWSSVLFRTGGYRGNPFSKHLPLPIQPEHFARWLALFTATVDAHFQGPKAEEAKNFARSVADTFQRRLGLLDGPPGLTLTAAPE